MWVLRSTGLLGKLSKTKKWQQQAMSHSELCFRSLQSLSKIVVSQKIYYQGSTAALGLLIWGTHRGATCSYCWMPSYLWTARSLIFSPPRHCPLQPRLLKGGVSLLHAWINVSLPFILEGPLSLRKKKIKYPQNVFCGASTWFSFATKQNHH